MSDRKKIVLLGATGSIGNSALKVIRQHSDKLELVGIAANTDSEGLATIADEFAVREICLFDAEAYSQAKASGRFSQGANLTSGLEGLNRLASLETCDTVLVAVVGTQGLLPSLTAIEAGKTLAIASKEILVLAGKFIMEAARRRNVRILPVDSEHNALFQCLQGVPRDQVAQIILTASGGSFRDTPVDQLDSATLAQALQHPNWDMGPKVTIDSATMANKGLEMIEASWLFGMAPEQIDVVIHTQSIVHSLVECIDGSVIGQLSPPDMTFAIQHTLLFPERAEPVSARLDFKREFQLDFRPPDLDRYPCLKLARECMQAGGIAPGIFNAANEIAVDAFIQDRIKFVEIPKIVEKTLEFIENKEPNSIEEVLKYDEEARSVAYRFVSTARKAQ